MSFILDALRKSEHERQRSAMPGIAQVPFGLPRREMPAWAIVVIVALAIAVLTLGGAWWRSARQDSAASVEPAAPARTEIPLVLPPAEVAFPPAVYSAPPVGESQGERSPAAGERPPPAPSIRRADAAGPASARDAETAEAEPAAEESTLPSAEALAAEGVALPRLRLELHAYSARPADRFVFINGTKYLEGATLAEGPRIVTIAPNGAVLSYLGHRFLLAPQ
jgi:general secretion pathway protein B